MRLFWGVSFSFARAHTRTHTCRHARTHVLTYTLTHTRTGTDACIQAYVHIHVRPHTNKRKDERGKKIYGHSRHRHPRLYAWQHAHPLLKALIQIGHRAACCCGLPSVVFEKGPFFPGAWPAAVVCTRPRERTCARSSRASRALPRTKSCGPRRGSAVIYGGKLQALLLLLPPVPPPPGAVTCVRVFVYARICTRFGRMSDAFLAERVACRGYIFFFLRNTACLHFFFLVIACPVRVIRGFGVSII